MAAAEQIIFDYRAAASLTPIQIAFCDFAVKLTVRPGMMRELDVSRLRQLGASDEQISLAAQVVAYFNYINRIADALGVVPEDWMEIGEENWKRRKAQFNFTNLSDDEEEASE